MSRENAGIRLHHEDVPNDHVPVHLGLVEATLQEDFLAEVRAAQLTVVHEMQPNGPGDPDQIQADPTPPAEPPGVAPAPVPPLSAPPLTTARAAATSACRPAVAVRSGVMSGSGRSTTTAVVGSRVILREKLQLMWHHNPRVTQGNQVLVGISTDGTKLWQRSFEHFAVGELGRRLPLGSWVLLQGSETTQILRYLAHHENLNLDVLDVNAMQVFNEGGYPTPVTCVIIADTKAQVALSGCRNFKSNDPLAPVCRLCGGNRLHCLGAFRQGNSNLSSGFGKGGGG